MLTCYPIEAANENWLHDSIVEIINVVHIKLDAHQALPNCQAEWEALVPNTLSAENRDNLIKARGVRDRIFTYKDSVSNLNQADRKMVFSALEGQNQIADLVSGIRNIDDIDIVYPNVKTAAHNLFVFCYGKLSDFEVRDRQYQIIFDYLETKICPFCGIERVMNPEETAQDQDHYLAKSIYPFAAVNMRNLVPMCRCCNRDYKKNIDMLRTTDGQRRIAFDPYACVPPTISLLNSIIDETISPPIPNWHITFMPNTEQVATWDDVFSIRARYKRDILDKHFSIWLRGLASKCEKDRKRNLIQANFTTDDVRNVLVNYKEDKSDLPNTGMAGFLEPLVFDFLLSQFDQGNERIIQLIKDAVLGIQLEVAA